MSMGIIQSGLLLKKKKKKILASYVKGRYVTDQGEQKGQDQSFNSNL